MCGICDIDFPLMFNLVEGNLVKDLTENLKLQSKIEMKQPDMFAGKEVTSHVDVT